MCVHRGDKVNVKGKGHLRQRSRDQVRFSLFDPPPPPMRYGSTAHTDIPSTPPRSSRQSASTSTAKTPTRSQPSSALLPPAPGTATKAGPGDPGNTNPSLITYTTISQEYASLRYPGHCPLGMYLIPDKNNMFVWDGVFFVHQGSLLSTGNNIDKH